MVSYLPFEAELRFKILDEWNKKWKDFRPVIDQKLLDILACPFCKSKVVEQDGVIACQKDGCKRQYPIRDGIPVMLIDEAKQPKQ